MDRQAYDRAMNPLSGVLGEAWQMYRRFAGHLLTIALVIYVAAAIVAGLLSLAGGLAGLLLAEIVELFAAFLLQATLVKAVQDVRDGRADLSIGETVSAATPYIWSVAAASILAGIAITIGLILIIVPGLWLITIWAVIIPVIVIERSGALNSFSRSRQLVRGHGWHVFGTLVLVFIIMIVVDIVLRIIFSALPLLWRDGLSTVVSGTLISPYIALVVTLIYYRLVGASADAGWPGAVADGAPGGYGAPAGPGGYGTPPPPPPGAGGYGAPAGPGGYGTPPPPPGAGGYGAPADPGGYGTPPPPPAPPPAGPGGFEAPPPPPPPPPPPGGYEPPPQPGDAGAG
jgi:hypothetical protein